MMFKGTYIDVLHVLNVILYTIIHADNKRYFLGRPADAFGVMKKLGLGISNKVFNDIK